MFEKHALRNRNRSRNRINIVIENLISNLLKLNCFYQVGVKNARRSTTESAAIFDVCKNINAIDLNLYEEGRAFLKRIIEMLTKLVNKLA